MTTSNRASGNRFEQELAEILAENGFWVHLLQQNKAGQPADIIAIKRSYATLIDCKVISTRKGFPLSRVEENQRFAMTRFTERTGNPCWFAVRFPDGKVHMISSNFIFSMIGNESGISEEFIRNYTKSFADWLMDVYERTRNEDDDL